MYAYCSDRMWVGENSSVDNTHNDRMSNIDRTTGRRSSTYLDQDVEGIVRGTIRVRSRRRRRYSAVTQNRMDGRSRASNLRAIHNRLCTRTGMYAEQE